MLQDATSLKLKKKVTNGTKIITTEYMQGFQYTNNVLDFFRPAPANSDIKGAAEGRVLITNQQGKVIWDITKERAKSVIPGKGFGPKVSPTREQLNLIKQSGGINYE